MAQAKGRRDNKWFAKTGIICASAEAIHICNSAVGVVSCTVCLFKFPLQKYTILKLTIVFTVYFLPEEMFDGMTEAPIDELVPIQNTVQPVLF